MPKQRSFSSKVFIEETEYSVSGKFYPSTPGTYYDPPEGAELDIQSVSAKMEDGSWVEVKLGDIDDEDFEKLYDAVMETDDVW